MGEQRRTEILHRVEPHARRRRRHSRIQEQASSHQRARAHHRPFASDAWYLDQCGAEEDAWDAYDGDHDAVDKGVYVKRDK